MGGEHLVVFWGFIEVNVKKMSDEWLDYYRMGPPVELAFSWFISGLTMVYGRYNYS